ncbi:MAG: carbamate kinase [Candidatus Acidiferrales bacterium]
MKSMVLAIGGNSLIRPGEHGTDPEQVVNARHVAEQVVRLVRDGYRIVLTHGNGPQVGAELLQCERATGQVPGHPLDVCDASTQGTMGYLLQQALTNEMKRAGLSVPVVTVVTQVVVSPDDPAMSHPAKPVGPFYSAEEAEERRRLFGWTIVEDAKRGYRRVVASPQPLEIVEWEAIKRLVQSGVLVIACGGGGIPVAWKDGSLVGVEAVIDKDRTSALLASKLHLGLFVIETDTDYVYLNYKKASQKALRSIDAAQLEAYAREGHFAPGSMGPKIEAVSQFLRSGGREAIICSCESLRNAVEGTAGTHIFPVEEKVPRGVTSRQKVAV